MKIILIGIALILSVIGIACGEGAPKAKREQAISYRVNGKDPGEYYRQFLYSSTGVCGTWEHLHNLLTGKDLKVGADAKDRDIMSSLYLALLPDGAYQAYYREFIVLRYADGGYYFAYEKNRTIKGRWMVQDDRLILSELGTGTAIEYNDQPAVNFKYDLDIVSAGLKGKTILLRMSRSTLLPFPDLATCPK